MPMSNEVFDLLDDIESRTSKNGFMSYSTPIPPSADTEYGADLVTGNLQLANYEQAYVAQFSERPLHELEGQDPFGKALLYNNWQF